LVVGNKLHITNKRKGRDMLHDGWFILKVLTR